MEQKSNRLCSYPVSRAGIINMEAHLSLDVKLLQPVKVSEVRRGTYDFDSVNQNYLQTSSER